jgi:hypothetical protein
MIINSFLIGLAEKVLPPVNVYSINYKWDLTPHGVPMWFNISLKGNNNNFEINLLKNFLFKEIYIRKKKFNWSLIKKIYYE